ncbi:MAG TPA: DUF6223 family protein [Cytophagales bacterium]|nr:DUF6223 family protein [Cytophagales bacterium]
MSITCLHRISLILHFVCISLVAQSTSMPLAIGTTPGRLWSIIYGVLGLGSVIIGWWALVRPKAHIANGRIGAWAALCLGLAGILLSGLHLARATGGFGTGSGKLGAIVALVLGLAGIVLSRLAHARVQRINKDNGTL